MSDTDRKEIEQDLRLCEMLRYKRPHNGITELQWARRFLSPYGMDDFDGHAWVKTVPLPDGGASRTLFSAHTDTVHRSEGRQDIYINHEKGTYLKTDGEPLGADNGAGVWLLLEMIDAKVPGTYVFHRGEERGGLGSRALSTQRRHWLAGFDRAIAFDRKGVGDVITHQSWSRCCSDQFAQALADALNAAHDDFMYLPDETGVFTDTANYTDHIHECTNVSVGYANEHTGNETLYLPHLYALRHACLQVDWESLPVHRRAGEVDFDYGGKYGSYSAYDYNWDRTSPVLDPNGRPVVSDLSSDRMFGSSRTGDDYIEDLLGEPLDTLTRAQMLALAEWDIEMFIDTVQDYVDDVTYERSRKNRRYR